MNIMRNLTVMQYKGEPNRAEVHTKCKKGINTRLEDTEEQINNLKDTGVEITEAKQKKINK